MRGIAWRASEREEFVAEHRGRSISPFRSSRTPGTASGICSCRLPTSRLPTTDYASLTGPENGCYVAWRSGVGAPSRPSTTLERVLAEPARSASPSSAWHRRSRLSHLGGAARLADANAQRLDPKAIEHHWISLKSFSGNFKDFEMTQIVHVQIYEDGLDERGGAVTIVTADEGPHVSMAEGGGQQGRTSAYRARRAGRQRRVLATNRRATLNRDDSIARPGAATFSKGRMSGSGAAISYDEMARCC